MQFLSKMPPKMEPHGAQEHATTIVLGPQRPPKSHMDPFSRKSKPPDLNFIKKVIPESKKNINNLMKKHENQQKNNQQ